MIFELVNLLSKFFNSLVTMLIFVGHIDKLRLEFEIFFEEGSLLSFLLAFIVAIFEMLPDILLFPHFVYLEGEIFDLLVFEFKLLLQRSIFTFVLV